jgi:hypothetical protein
MGGMEFGAPELAELSQITNPLAVPFMAAQGVGAGYNRFVSPVVSQAGAEQAAGNTLLARVMGAPEDVGAALRNEPRSLLGQVPASQRLAEANLYEPGIATLQADLLTGETEIGRQSILLEQRRLQGIQQQLHAIDQQILRQGQSMSPEARAKLDEVRNSLLREQAAARRQIQQPLQATGEQIPAVGQRAPGEAVAARAVEVRDRFRRERIQPLYDAAYASAGNVNIPVYNIVRVAEDILGGTMGNIAPGVAARTVRDLRRLQGGATLRDLDGLRKSVNKDMAAAMVAGKDLSDLRALHDVIDETVERSRIPARAKIEYATALNAYRSEFVPRFRTGAAYDLLRITKKNQSGIIPSETVSKFLANEDAAAQFTATFGDDAVARRAMESGIQDLARRPESGIVDAAGAVVPENVDAFVNKYRRQFELMGIDGDALLAPVRQEAGALRRGMAELDREAAFFRTSSGEALRKGADFVDEMLKDPAAMQVGLRRLSEEGRSALTKEVVDRAIRFLNERTPEQALKYLADNKTTIRMAIDKPYYDRLINLAENQRALQDVASRAKEPIVNLDVDLSAVPVEKLTDLSLVAREIDRIEKAERMSGLRPSQAAEKVATEEVAAAKKAVSGFLSRAMMFMEKILDYVGTQLNRKTVAILADALANNPSKAADLLEQAAARKAAAAAPRAPESRARTVGRAALMGGLTFQNEMAPENRNAMAR